MTLSAIGRPLRRAVMERDQGCCRYCRLSQEGQAATFHIDHVHPRGKGGATVLENLVFQCPQCSLHKSDKVDAVDALSGELVDLFHPLKRGWHEHFALESDGAVVGLTPIGRATVDALGMNAHRPKSARAAQLMMGIIRRD
jgi:hypothetical protein